MNGSDEQYPRVSTIYGPVDSWRLGRSLGVDVLFVDSICSFKCVYCQLGKINVHTGERREFVPTAQVAADLSRSDWRSADVITFSGSGEPTLAANLGDVIRVIKSETGKPIVVLTNAAHLDDEGVVADLCLADRVFCKLDAPDEETFRRINRPVEGLTVEGIAENIARFGDVFKGSLAIQTMYSPFTEKQVASLAKMLARIHPSEVQINTPTRAIPREWFIEARGNYEETPYPAVTPRRVSEEEVIALTEDLKRLTGLNVVNRYSAS